MLTPFTATRLNHALGTIDTMRFVTGATATVSDYDSDTRGQRHVIGRFSHTARRKEYSYQVHAHGEDARKQILSWIEDMARTH